MSLQDIFKSDNFYALSLEEARPELERFMYSYLGIFPIEKGKRPQTDGKKIFLEPTKTEFQDDKSESHNNRNMSLYLSDILHEMLHIREGSFLMDARPFLSGFSNHGLAHAVFNIVEDARIEHNAQGYLKTEDSELLRSSNNYLATKRKFPKSIADKVMEMYSGRMIMKGMPSDFNPSIKSQENTALQTRIENEDLNNDGINTVEDVVERLVGISESVYREPVEAVWQVVPQVYELLTKAFPNIEKDFPTKNSPYAPVKAPKSQKPGKGKKGEGEKGKKQGNGAGDKGEDKKEGQQIAYTGFRGDVHDFSAAEKKGQSLKDLVGDYKPQGEDKGDKKSKSKQYGVGQSDNDSQVNDGGIVQIVTYDHIKKAYIHLEKLKLTTYEGSNPEFVSQLNAYDILRRRIVEHFEMLKPNELQRIPFSEVPDELNIEAVIEVLCDPSLRTKSKVYDSYIVNERDALTGILIDISGSTAGRLQSGKRVIDVEKESAGLIYQALTEIDDRVLLYAFSTSGITNLYQLTGLENLGAVRPEAGNADGVAIRGVVSEMKKEEARDKTLIVITDGKPVATGKGADPVIDTSMAFMEAEAQGIRTVYFNVDNNPSNYFDVLTRNTTYAKSIRDVEQLPFAVSEFVLGHG